MAEESRYYLAKKINRGGMAEIYLGKVIGEDGFQRLCAIKRILPHYAQDQEFIQMFRDEAHICKRLQHANIVKVEGFEEVEGSYAIIMEYVDGSDLRSMLHAIEQAKQKMSVPFCCYIIAEAARGLHYAHTKEDEITQQPLGIVHRDISPQNILVSYDGEVKVTDFGIADAESKITETRPGIVKGKYSYMSPEQISAKEVDARTDVFALSIVLWEMLAMKRLFQGESEVDTIQRVKNCVIPQELQSINSEVDQELDDIIKKGLAKDPKKRYKTAADFEKDLRRYMSRKFPDFTSEELGNFLKKLMEAKRTETAHDIKKTLTETNLKPGRRRSLPGISSSQPLASVSAHSIPPPLDEPSPANLSVIKVASKTAPPAPLIPPPPPNPRASKPFHRVGQSSPVYNSIGMIKIRRAERQKFTKPLFLVLGALLAFLILKNLMAPSKPAQLLIRTQPSRVKIMVNNSYINEGRYVRATSQRPLRINLAPGRYSIVISRLGYHSVRWDVELDSGDKLVKDDFILKEKSVLAALKIRTKSDSTTVINIEDGFFIAKFSPSSNYVASPDIIVGKTYQMKIIDRNKDSFTCKFVAKATSWRQPNELLVDTEKKKCSMSGPS